MATDPASLYVNLVLDSLFTALANDIDASNGYGNYQVSESKWVFEGLGHTISNVSGLQGGLIHKNSGRISNIHIKNWRMTSLGGDYCAGILVDLNDNGSIDHASATGFVRANYHGGGLVGCNFYESVISHSYAKARVVAGVAGGLAGFGGGTIESSYAEGDVEITLYAAAGGLVGEQHGKISNSYSLAKVHTQSSPRPANYYGGLIGMTNAYAAGTVTNSYAVGKITHPRWTAVLGGIIGCDVPEIAFSNVYWDFANGVTDPGQGAGNLPYAPGLTGLTDAQLKAGLPQGFDPKIWGSNPSINSGYPYLLANPPQ